MTQRLKLELVPKPTWGINVRSLVPRPTWDDIRKIQYRLANFRCEICGDTGKNQGSKHNLECHERWSYDDDHQRQTLVGLIALCPRCHEVAHFGRAQAEGRAGQAIDHMMKVNQFTYDEAMEHLQKAFAVWTQRSAHDWAVDVSWLSQHGVAIPSWSGQLPSLPKPSYYHPRRHGRRRHTMS